MNSGRLRVMVALFLLAGFLSVSRGTQWQAVTPSLRRSATLVADTAYDRAILFGGTDDRLLSHWFNDLWTIQLDPWGYFWQSLRADGDPPPGRSDHNAVFDPVHQRMLVFGGYGGQGAYRNDVWSLDLRGGGAEWEELHPSGTPPEPRGNVFMVYSPLRNSVVFFGGITVNYVWFDDLWELKLDSMVWRPLAATGQHPEARASGGAFYDVANNRMLMFGGMGPVNFYNELWALDLTPGSERWSLLNPGGTRPAARNNFAGANDPAGTRYFVFAGWDYQTGEWYNDCFELDVPMLTWTRLQPSNEPPIARRSPCGVFDHVNLNFLCFGGDLGGDYYLAGTDYIDVGSGATGEWQHGSGAGGPRLVVRTPVAGPVTISYYLPGPGHVDCRIVDAAGRVLRCLYSGEAAGMNGTLTWNGRDDAGKPVAAGQYFCLLQTETVGVTRKFVLAE